MPNLKLPRLNDIKIAGRLTRDIELSYTPSNMPTCGFSVAVDDGFGEKKQTYFFNCRAFGKQAERANGWKRGMAVLVEGRMVNDKYKDRDGNEQDRWKIIVGIMHDMEWQDDEQPSRGERRSAKPAPRREAQPEIEDDLPF